MKQKLLFFFLTAFLSLIGGGELWAQTTVGYTEAIDVTTKTLQARSLSNGGLDHLTISEPIKGTSIGDYPSTSTGVYVGSTQYTSTNSWRKSENTSEYSPNQYVGYTLTVDDGYRLNISKVAAKILVADDTYTWKVEIENSSGTKIYTSADNLKADKTSQDALADNVSLSHLEGTVTVKLYMYQGGKTKYFCINYLELDVTVEEDPRATLTVFDKEGTWPSPFGFVEDVASSKQKTLMFKFNEASSLKPLTKVDPTKLSVTSDNTGVFTIGSYTVGVNGSGDRERIYIPIQVVSEGTANVVVSFAGDNNFKPHDAVSIPLTTKNIKLETYSSYPFTWDFANNDWESSKIQMAANSTDWASYSGEGRSKQTSVSATSGIDMIEGLAFSGLTADDGSNSNGTLCLDWTNKLIWLNGTVTLPALAKGHVVTFTSSAAPKVVPENMELVSSEGGAYQYKATAAVATPAFTFESTHISSISVTKSSVSITRNGRTSTHLKGNPPTLKLGTEKEYWGNYAFNLIDGVSENDFTVTVSPSPSGVLSGNPTEMKYTAEYGGYYYLTLTGASVGTAHVTVSLNSLGDGYESVTPYEFDVRVVQTANPHKWNFEDSEDYWTTARGDLNASYWVESADATANPGEVMSNVAFSGEELTKNGTDVLPETQGLLMTAVKGSSRFNIGKYYRLGNRSKASITIPYATTGQTVTFKVETATAGMERGITAASSNLELISGQVSDKVSFFTYRVTSDGDAVFRQTSDDAGLKIYYIDLKSATPAASELKFVDSEGHDISNTHVSIKSGTSGNLDNYFKLSKSDGTAWTNIPVTFNGDIISVDNSSSWEGSFTLGNSTGEATITARTTDSSVETGIAVLYVSVKDQPTVTLNYTQAPPYSVDYGQDFNGGTSTVTGTSSVSLPVKYKSSNERVATVDANGHVTCVGVGTATITAYTEETTNYLYAEASYDVTYNSGNVVFQFEPSEVKLALGKNITPFLHYDQSSSLDPATLNFTMSKSGIVTCEVVADAKQSDKKVIKITSEEDPSVIGERVIVTASVKERESSTVYYTTVAVTITAAGTRNFSWADGENPTYTMYVGDYMKMPAITGNSNGNDSYSKTDAQKYIYHIEAGSKNKVTWNTDGYYLYEGVPDYGIIDNGTEDNNGTRAAIFYATGQPSNGIPHTLFLYARAVGTVTIRAYDPQNHDLYCDATLKILERTTIDNAASTYINGMKFPYTWDFTGNFDMTDIVANSHYWERFDDNHYAAGIGFFNVDWADSDADDNYNERSFKPFVAGAATETTAGNYMPLFYGLEMSLQNSGYAPKVDRVRITDYNSSNPDAARLVINGGTTQLRLPKAPTQPSNYRIYMKVKTTSGTVIEVGGKKYGVESGKYTEGCQLMANTDAIIYFDVTDTSSDDAGSVINLDNVSIYWIATSTEAKILNYYKGTNPHLTYAAAAYSYNEDLDLTKSNEVNGGAAYYASSFTTDNNKDAGAFADDGNQYAVVMTPLTIMGNYVTANTGMLLKYDNVSEYDTDTQIPFYMIANPRNVATYKADPTIDGTTHKNYLVGTGATTPTVSGHETTVGGQEYTNFLMAAAYIYYTDVTKPNTAQGDYRFDRDWSFYPIMGSGAVPTQRSYLHIPGNLYVNSSGQIVDMPNSARAAFDVDSAADETAEAPATKGALSIVFEDEMPATPDDPATEEPEDGDSDKDKDRPRKPGDDGWPKPPFPPFPPIITDIDSVNTETTDNAVWHSMEGVRISQPTKPGLYIRNGKKVVIK